MAAAPRTERAARIFNFGAGPAAMPVEVLERAKAELVNWHEAGMSVMEMSHRGKEFVAIAAEAEADLRNLAGIPSSYRVLFLQGGASMQFSGVPMNLLRGRKSADFVNTGEWSKKAIAEMKKFGEANVVASSEDRNFTYIPKQSAWKRSKDAAYLHICSNETIGGVEFHWTPDTGDVPLVADMSSHILSRPLDVARYGLIYAGAVCKRLWEQRRQIGHVAGLVVLHGAAPAVLMFSDPYYIARFLTPHVTAPAAPPGAPPARGYGWGCTSEGQKLIGVRFQLSQCGKLRCQSIIVYY